MTEVPAPYLQFDGFLSDDDLALVLEFVGRNESSLRPSDVLVGADGEDPEEIRRSRSLFDIDEIWPLFEPVLSRVLPSIRKELDVAHFGLDRIERQLAVHHDGDFFAPHNDSGGPEVATRQITYVYYFNMAPRQFEGGELRVYHSISDGDAQPQGSEFVTLAPRHNSIVFFPSWVHHEVRPVRSMTDGLEGARMTFHGWFHSAPQSVTVSFDHRTRIQAEKLPTFTEQGFEVRQTPPGIHAALMAAYTAGRADATAEAPDPEVLPDGEPELIDIGDLSDSIGEQLRSMHEEWAGVELEHTATYGIRNYGRGQTLRRHCDRLHTHIISSIIHVDNDCEDPWPLVIEDHDGVEHRVVLEPGQMVLYESASCPHARPEPLKANRFANLFVHFKPKTGWEIDEAALFASDQ